MFSHAQFFCNLGRKICHEIFVKMEKAEYLSNQLTFAHFGRKLIFPIKNWTFEQFFIFSISEMFHFSRSTSVKINGPENLKGQKTRELKLVIRFTMVSRIFFGYFPFFSEDNSYGK